MGGGGVVIGGGGDDFNNICSVYPRGLVSLSSLSYFLFVGYSSITSHSSFLLSLVMRHIQKYFKKKTGRKQKFIKPQQDKARSDGPTNMSWQTLAVSRMRCDADSPEVFHIIDTIL